ncbi:class I SAM-dependent methyltransferase [Aliiroseovarius sp. KMU-50]|uniref:Class I SAM-dependent methyltransferase n=1 Tax=Aliiroseovarius salicola TaxID=3009082 RepID=A0ABT4W072_9RHOB|nr:class I SAM-dependent methyltransferase [Aliiroseovarius sp. KMU-50]MDA5093183.1 class I SAM-dependent methyltransferase [Aliiroseovarius sp. KMU-50]
MSADRQTLKVYDTQAAEYETRVAQRSTPGLSEFITALPQSAYVLDLGCGPGLSARAMMDHGLTVDAVDGSPAMVARASELGVSARQELFQDVSGTAEFNGIFANFSLLHMPRCDMPDMLNRLHTLMKPEGIIHIGLKLGSGEARDRLGRFYAYYQQDEIEALLTSAGFLPYAHILGAGEGLDGWSSEWIVIQAKKVTNG